MQHLQQKNRDIVTAAQQVRRVDEDAGGVLKIAAVPLYDAENIGVGQVAVQAVGTQQEQVAFTAGMLGRFRGHLALRADHAGDHIAQMRSARLRLGNLAVAHLLFHHGVIAGEPLDRAITKAVAAGVAHVRDPQTSPLWHGLQRDQRGAHAAQPVVPHSQGVHGAVRRKHRLLQVARSHGVRVQMARLGQEGRSGLA